MDLLAAFQFLTCLPVRKAFTTAQIGRSTSYFPIVGLCLGLVLAGANWLLLKILPPTVVIALLIALLIVLTGALHLDGLADTCDGLAGHRTPEERWQVMMDSRSGAFGIIGIVIVLLLKYVCLSHVPAELATASLIIMPMIGRWTMVSAIFIFPYARPSGLGSSFKQATRWPQFAAATVISLSVAAALLPIFSVTGFIAMLSTWAVVMLLAIYFRHKFAGLTGDNYGAINEVAEVTVLMVILIVFRLVPDLV